MRTISIPTYILGLLLLLFSDSCSSCASLKNQKGQQDEQTSTIPLGEDAKKKTEESTEDQKGTDKVESVDIQAMIDSIPNGDYDRLIAVLEGIKDGKSAADVEIDKTDSFNQLGYTALQEAIELEKEDIVKFLLKKGADVNTMSLQQETPLEIAVNRNNASIAKLLLGHAQIQQKKTYNQNNELLLNSAIKINKDYTYHHGKDGISEVENILLDQLDQNDLNKQGDPTKKTPLLWTAFYGRWQLAQALLDKGADPNLQDFEGQSTLFYAAQGNNQDLVVQNLISQLIKEGAQLDLKDKAGNTPFHKLVAHNHVDIVKEILNDPKNNAAILKGLTNNAGQKPLDIATSPEMEALLNP